MTNTPEDEEEKYAWEAFRLAKQLPPGYQIVKDGEAPQGWFVAVPTHEILLYTTDNHVIGRSTDYELWTKGPRES